MNARSGIVVGRAASVRNPAMWHRLLRGRRSDANPATMDLALPAGSPRRRAGIDLAQVHQAARWFNAVLPQWHQYVSESVRGSISAARGGAVCAGGRRHRCRSTARRFRTLRRRSFDQAGTGRGWWLRAWTVMRSTSCAADGASRSEFPRRGRNPAAADLGGLSGVLTQWRQYVSESAR